MNDATKWHQSSCMTQQTWSKQPTLIWITFKNSQSTHQNSVGILDSRKFYVQLFYSAADCRRPGTDGYHPTWSTVVHSLWDWISNPWLTRHGLIENFGHSYKECRCQTDYKISDKSNHSRILTDFYLWSPGQQILTFYVSLSYKTDKFQVATRLFSKNQRRRQSVVTVFNIIVTLVMSSVTYYWTDTRQLKNVVVKYITGLAWLGFRVLAWRQSKSLVDLMFYKEKVGLGF